MDSPGPAPDLAPSPAPSRRARRVPGWLVVVVVVLAALVLRTVVSGQRALDRGLEALQAGDELGARVTLREAVSWYLPGAPWRGEALDALWTLHEQQVAEGRLSDAVATLSAARAGLYAARSVLHPDEEELARVDAALAPLMARWEAEAAQAQGRVSPGTLQAREGAFEAILARETRPHRGFGLLAVVGLLLWLGATWRGLGREGPGRWRWLGAGLGGLVAFLVGVALA